MLVGTTSTFVENDMHLVEEFLKSSDNENYQATQMGDKCKHDKNEKGRWHKPKQRNLDPLQHLEVILIRPNSLNCR